MFAPVNCRCHPMMLLVLAVVLREQCIINNQRFGNTKTTNILSWSKMYEQFSKYIEDYDTDIIPGHGTKEKWQGTGSYVWKDQEKFITFWLKCKPRPDKRVASDSLEVPQSKQYASLLNMSDVDNSDEAKEKQWQIYPSSAELLGSYDSYPQSRVNGRASKQVIFWEKKA